MKHASLSARVLTLALLMLVAVPQHGLADDQSSPVVALAQDSDAIGASQQATAVRQRHLDELMNIPHVTGVAIETNDSKVTIFVVQVDKAANVDNVARQVPPKLEGYDVDVEPESTGVGF